MPQLVFGFMDVIIFSISSGSVGDRHSEFVFLFLIKKCLKVFVRGWNSCCEVFTDMAKIATKVLGYGLWIIYLFSVVYEVIGY